MSAICPVCGRIYCDHTAEERGQTYEEMGKAPTRKELDFLNSCDCEPGGGNKKIEYAKKNRHS